MNNLGYRHYFYLVNKKTVSEIKNFNEKQLFDWGLKKGLISSHDTLDDYYLPLYTIGKECFGFGAYFEGAKEIQESGKPLFTDGYLSDIYEEYEPFILGKEGLEIAIEWNRKKVEDYYKFLLTGIRENKLSILDNELIAEEREQHFKDILSQWESNNGRTFAFNMNINNPTITNSWKYEYAVFELVRLYKTTNWEKYDLLFLGW